MENLKPTCAFVARDYLKNAFGLTCAQLRAAIERGDLPKPLTLGGAARWRLTDLQKILDTHQTA